MKKKLLALLLAIATITCFMPTIAFAALPDAADPDVWDNIQIKTASGEIAVLNEDYTKTLIENDYYTSDGYLKTYKYTLKRSGLSISGGGSYEYSTDRTEKALVTVDASLNNIDITLDGVTALAEIKIPAGNSANFTLVGENNVDSIYGEDATGTAAKLAFGGNGELTTKHIGGQYGTNKLSPQIEINDGTYLIKNDRAATIGGGQYGSANGITINGGTFDLDSNYGAAIGGGQNGYGKNILINGGTIKAKGGYGAVIGGGQDGKGESITINGGTIEASGSYGAVIGGGQYKEGENITINGGIIEAQGSFGALIGAGQDANAENISITGGKLRLETKHQSGNKEYWGVGIGAGSNSAKANTTANNITVSNVDISILVNPTTSSMQNKGYGFAIGTPNVSTDATNVSMNCGVYNGHMLNDAYHAKGYSSYLLSNHTYIVGKTDTVSVEDGKLTAGKFTFNPIVYVAEDYTVKKSDDGTLYEVVIKSSPSEKGEIIEEKKTKTEVSDNITDQNEKEAAKAVLDKTSVNGVAKALTEKGKDQLIDAAKMNNPELKEVIDSAKLVDIEITVKAEVKESKTTEEEEKQLLIFELKPYAVVTATSNDGKQISSDEIVVDNDFLAKSAAKKITVNLGSAFKPAQVLHIREDKVTEVFNQGDNPSYTDRTFTYKDQIVTLEITQFSEVKLLATALPTYEVSFNANGGSGTMNPISVLADDSLELPENGFKAPAGREFKAWLVNEEEHAPGFKIESVRGDIVVKALWKDAAVTPVNPENPTDIATGDSNGIVNYTLIGLMALMGMALALTLKKVFNR